MKTLLVMLVMVGLVFANPVTAEDQNRDDFFDEFSKDLALIVSEFNKIFLESDENQPAEEAKDIILLLPRIPSFELTDGNGTARFMYTPPNDHKQLKELTDYIKGLYNENPAYYNGRTWDFRNDD